MHSWTSLGRILIGLLWIAWAGYWIIAARHNLTNRRTESLLTGASYRVLLIIGILLLAFPVRSQTVLDVFLWPHSALIVAIGLAMTISGLSIAVWARRHLGRYWSGRITLKVDHRVIQSGPYALVRHPIYSGILLALLGTVISIGTVQSCLGLALMFLSFVRKLTLEERWLSTDLGSEYDDYRHRVKALIPYLV
jgi:protein-S-isoprenylcysteine O-methyltransferase Ste14